MEYEKELEIGSQDDMLANSSKINDCSKGFSGFEGIVGLALVSALFGDKDPSEIKEIMKESDKPTTLKSLEKQFKLTTNTLFEILELNLLWNCQHYM